MDTVFTKIIEGSIPSIKLYEDTLCLAILDINPMNKGHALVICKECYPTMAECPDDVLGHLLSVAKSLDAKMRSTIGADATNILINNGPAAGQEVPHLHIHVIPRYLNDKKRLSLTKEQYSPGEMAAYGEKLRIEAISDLHNP
jgi:histidine triad (HIT) family protein